MALSTHKSAKPKSKYRQVAGSRATMGGNYTQPGNYRVKINRCKHQENRKEIEQYLVEYTILESDNTVQKVGSDATWMCSMNLDAAAGNILAFMIATTGCEAPDEDDEESLEQFDTLMDSVWEEEQILAGQEFSLKAWNKLTQAGKDFTRVTWGAAE